MGLVLLLAPLLLLRDPTAPERGTVLATAGPTDAPFVARTFASRAGRSSAVARVAIATATTTTTTTIPPATTAPPARRRLDAVATTTTTRPRPRPTTTTTTAPRPAPAPTTTRPPAPSPAPAPAPAHSQTGEASWYRGPDGECAHNTAPIGSIIRVTNLANGKSTTCRVAGRGPYGAGRIVDLTQSTFARVASVDAGVFRARVDW